MNTLAAGFRSTESLSEMTVLHLEDSVNDAVLVQELLTEEWPLCRISRVATREEFQCALEAGDFDVILSDYSLPDFDGLSALDQARLRWPQKPFIFLSGTIGEERAIEALKRGAIDYIIKDRPSRLIPSIRQALAVRRETEQRQHAEEALRQNQERFRQITENVADLIAVLDLQGHRVYNNPAYSTILGDIDHQRTDSFAEIHPDDRERVREIFRETIRTGLGQRTEYRFLLPDGSVRHIESQGSILRDGAGQVANVLVVSRDVTARREADKRIREQAALLDKARDAIVATDLEHRIAYWNASAERLYGWTAAEVFGRKLEDLNLEFDPVRFKEARAQLFATGEWRGDFRLKTKSGEMVQVESTWSLVVESLGEPHSILFIDTDVTEKKKLEVQLLRTQRMESIGMLASGVAHDLNNVLTPILMAVDLLRARLHDEADRRTLGNVEASAQHGSSLVRQLMAFARGGEGQRTEVQIGTIVGELKKLLSQALPRSVELRVRSNEAPWTVMADATQLNQVLMNLCINARDAMPQGGRIEIVTRNLMLEAKSAQLGPGAEPGPYLHIAVSDTGSGIPPAILDQIFDPFFTTKVAGKGTGLGLSTVIGIIKSHGGFVSVESVVGQGTVFHLFLPARIAESAASSPLAPLPAMPVGEAILLVEDDDAVRETLALLLEHSGYRVIAAANGAQALAAFDGQRASIFLVITDMMLPGMSGNEIITALRERDSNLRIIAMSGVMDEEALGKLPVPGPAIQPLSKPLTAQMLLTAIRGNRSAA